MLADKKILLGIFVFLPLLLLVSAENFGYNYLEGDLGNEQNINYSTISVNNSQYLRGYSPTGLMDLFQVHYDSIYCKLVGCTMEGDINMGENNITNVSYVNTDDLILKSILLDYSDEKSLYDIISNIQSAGKFFGGDITDNGDGTVSVSSGYGLIKDSDSDTSSIYLFSWDENSSIDLVNNSANYLYLDYNYGSPTIKTSTSIPTDHNTKILLGEVFREGDDLHEVTAGQIASNFNSKVFWKDIEVHGKFQRSSGLIISETGTRNFAISSGIVYSGLTKTIMSSFDSSSGDTFTYMYRDGSGGWNRIENQTQIDNLHYDDGSGTLATLNSGFGWRPDEYGVHWVYEDIDGDMYVLYGWDSYTLTEAQEAQPPSTIPDLLSEVGGLVGKIIIQKNSDSFEEVLSPFDVYFSATGIYDHNSLAGLQGGSTNEYYHLSESEYNGNWTGKDLSTDSLTLVNGSYSNKMYTDENGTLVFLVN